VFVGTDIQEPALKSLEENKITIINCIFAFFMPLGIGAILTTILACTSDPASIGLWILALVLGLSYIGTVIYSLVKRNDFNEEVEKEYAESYERLQSPEYARALQKAGFDVPYWFLEDK